MTSASEIITAIRGLDSAGKAAVLMALVAEVAQGASNGASQTPVSGAPALVDADALAQALALPRSWLMSQARQGKIPCIRKGKYVRFNIAEVEAALRRVD